MIKELKDGKNEKTTAEEFLRGKGAETVSKDYKIRMWKEKLYAPEINPHYAQLRESLEAARDELRKEFGDNFKTLQLGGSWAKGCSKVNGPIEKKSDVDLLVYLKEASEADVEKAKSIVEKVVKYEGKLDINIIEFDKLKKNITELRITKGNESTKEVEDVIVNTAALFANIPFSDKDVLLDSERELLREIRKNPQAELIWEKVREMYSAFAVGIIDNGIVNLQLYKSGVTPNFFKAIVNDSLGISMEEFEEVINDRKKKMSLPDLGEMTERLAA